MSIDRRGEAATVVFAQIEDAKLKRKIHNISATIPEERKTSSEKIRNQDDES